MLTVMASRWAVLREMNRLSDPSQLNDHIVCKITDTPSGKLVPAAWTIEEDSAGRADMAVKNMVHSLDFMVERYGR